MAVAPKIGPILSASLTPLIALIAAFIALQQWHLNRARLRYDLFDKRYKLFEKIAAYIADCANGEEITHERRVKFLKETKLVRFMFDKETYEYISLVFTKSGTLWHYDFQLKNPQQDQDMGKLADERSAILAWFNGELSTIETKFEKHLGLLEEVASIKQFLKKDRV